MARSPVSTWNGRAGAVVELARTVAAGPREFLCAPPFETGTVAVVTGRDTHLGIRFHPMPGLEGAGWLTLRQRGGSGSSPSRGRPRNAPCSC